MSLIVPCVGPCVGPCKLDAITGLCLGCARSGDEVASIGTPPIISSSTVCR